MIKAVIIDLDDTLFLTEQAAFEMENEALKQINRPPMSREIHLNTWGAPLFEIIGVRSPGVDIGLFKEKFVSIVAGYVKTGKVDALTTENLRALDTFIGQDRQLFIVTSRVYVEVAHLLESDHVLANRIAEFYYWENTPFHKPDPRVFDQLLQDYNLQPNECVYVGDSITDAEAAKKAGLYFIASLESNLRSKEDFSDHKVDAFVDAFENSCEIIQGLEVSPNLQSVV